MEVTIIYPAKKIVAVSHCILNQNTVVQGLERAYGSFPLANYLLEKGVSFLQLPCPEFLMLSSNRPPMTYEAYDALPNYRQQCREMVTPIIQQLIMYQENNYDYLGIIGISDSPNCSISQQTGILMEEFFSLCDYFSLSKQAIEVPTWYSEEQEGNFNEALDKFIGF